MEFWGAEVKTGEPLTVKPGDGMVLHLSQASLGELKKDKGSESICLYVNIDGKKLVLGTLNSDKLPQQQFDLVFDRDFELSHNWKCGSVFFFGYKASNPIDEELDDDVDDSDEDIPLTVANNGKSEAKGKDKEAEKKSNAAKNAGPSKQVKIVEPSKDAKADDEDESTDEDETSDDDSDDDSEMAEGEDGSDGDDSDDSEEEETPTPKKAVAGKKRPAESATKTPVPDKKVKLATPQKTDGKKGGSGHVATPHPSKQAGKTAANKNQQTPKSTGAHQCKTCNKTFGSESALGSHSKAKHSAGK